MLIDIAIKTIAITVIKSIFFENNSMSNLL